MSVPVVLDRFRVVLARPSHPGNIGAVARAMKTMGLSRLALVAPRSFPDEEATARASGAVDVLEKAQVCDSLDDALAGCLFAAALSARQRDLGPQPLSVREAMVPLLAAGHQGEVALVFGNETAGLTNEEVSRCQMLLTIPTSPDYRSLNLGAAVQIVCHELWQAVAMADGDAQQQTPRATLGEMALFYDHLETVMRRAGFLDPARPGRLMLRMRRLFGRAAVEPEELAILRGVLGMVAEHLPPEKPIVE